MGKSDKQRRFVVKRHGPKTVVGDVFEKAMAQDWHIVLGPSQETITTADGTTAIVDWSQLLTSPVNVTITFGNPPPKKEPKT